jgi:hypothetical protein
VLVSRDRLGIGIGGFAPRVFPFELLRQFALQPASFPGLQKEGMLLHIFEDAFLLNLPLEAAQSAIN